MRYSLDSNIVIAAMAGQRTVVDRISACAIGDVTLSSIVMHELLFGAYNSNRVESNLARLAELSFPISSFDAPDARAAGEIRAALRRRGTPIGPYDLLIAGQALARSLVIVTANRREFDRIDGLSVEDWTLPIA